MALKGNIKATIFSALRKLGVFATAGIATWAVSPAALKIVPTKYDFIVGLIIAPLLWEANKKLGGKGKPAPSPSPAK